MNDHIKLPKFKIPQKGRIRVVLIVVVLTIAIIKLTGPCGSGGKRSVDTDNNTGIDSVNTKNPKSPEPDDQLTFDDLRQLIKEYGLPINASTQEMVVGADANINAKISAKIRGNGKSKSNPKVKNDGTDDTLSLYLSLDTALQKYANSMFRQYKPRYAAVAAINPATGRVLALASYTGPGIVEDVSGAGTGNTDLYLRSPFPAASVFKTVVAAAGIEKAGMTGASTIEHYGRNHTLYRVQIQRELKASRDITLADAFAYSINPAFARIALFRVNKDIVTDYGRRFGFNEAVPFEFDVDVSEMFSPDSDFSVAEFASGFNRKTTISPLFGALLAGAVCENGVINRPTVVDSIYSSRRDTCIYGRRTRVWRRAVKEQTAAELRGLMKKVTHYGTARTPFRRMRESPKYAAFEFGGKTGSVNKLGLGRVDWFVGFARNPINKNERIAIGVVTTHGEYWTVHSSYIGAELFKKYISGVGVGR